ncbi:lsg1 [Symbiodinium natans]|uniref:Lsg1 protein n=1 Tax=Symbiodinium natans TaxID=878477 RepID=A0A812U3A7_9DINO|nr:lsg1 [Symbiodinium natans]
MGLAKICIGKTYTACGTPDYFAPELIASTGHTVAVDWWTLGIFLFELLSGHPPFESSYPMQTYQKIMRGIAKVAFPPKCKGSAEDLVKSLCKHDPAERLPMKKGGSRNIKSHPFYKGFDWASFESLRPFVRSLVGASGEERRGTMTRKKSGAGLGNSLANDRRKRAEGYNGHKASGVPEGQANRSVLEQTSLDDFIAKAELAKADFHAARGQAVECTTEIIYRAAADPATTREKEAEAKKVDVPIPWRPPWQEASSAEELASAEGQAFLEWRRGLAKLEEEDGLVLTPYERNLDFWRQLWRCVERSDVLVQILDARDPEFYRCRDLERYIEQFPNKRHLLLLNKADFLNMQQREQWTSYWTDKGVETIFFSALRELHKQQRACASSSARDARAPEDEDSESDLDSEPDDEESVKTEDAESSRRLPPHGPLEDGGMSGVADCARLLDELQARMPPSNASRRGVVGFVGYPNVGKSSVINALFGAKKVSMSRTPGKTKHLQTLELSDSNITLCDCPGLVFPSVVATRAHLVINGTVPLDELRDFIDPIRLIVGKIGPEPILQRYGVSASEVRDGAIRRGVGEASDEMAHQVLCGLATHRHHFLRVGVPDETWAARRVLRDFCTGQLLHCEHPPGSESSVEPQSHLLNEQDSESDFSDLDAFLEEGKERKMTKRKMRHLQKQMAKGGVIAPQALEKRKGAQYAGKNIRGKTVLG